MRAQGGRNYREALIEFVEQGSYLKATAMDPDTLTEVSVVGPIQGSRELLKRTVLAKLDFVIEKNGATPAKSTKPLLLNTVTYGPGGTIRKIK